MTPPKTIRIYCAKRAAIQAAFDHPSTERTKARVRARTHGRAYACRTNGGYVCSWCHEPVKVAW